MEVILVKDVGNVALVSLTGRMDSAGVQAASGLFREMVIHAGRDTVLDMSGVEFMASVGMRLFIEAQKALADTGAKLVLAGPRELVAEGLRIAGIDRMLAVAADVPAALALFD
ncbi:MAG: STAS domain-containing protein [Proteobacteria bacterium]|nr:STAS domain-containing protein [Pseudomonadota bacterium]